MSETQDVIRNLEARGWTIAAIADEMGVHWLTVSRWKDGTRSPSNVKSVLVMLRALEQRKRVPPQKRYTQPRKGKGTG